MTHADPERLALMALGERTPGDEHHLRGCLRCQAELVRFSRVVAVARDGGEPGPLETPPPGLWVRVAAATGAGLQGDAVAGDAPHPARPVGDSSSQPVRPDGDRGPQRGRSADDASAKPVRAPRWPWWRRPALAAAGLVAAVAIAAGAWAGVRELTRSPGPPAPQATVVARIALRPLPEFPQWRAASGTAVMATGPAGQQLTVALNAPDRSGFYEVWLLARDGHSMISLGDLGPGHHGTFTMPPGVDLSNFSRVDVSLQAFNGSTAHSRTSVVRGSLPPS